MAYPNKRTLNKRNLCFCLFLLLISQLWQFSIAARPNSEARLSWTKESINGESKSSSVSLAKRKLAPVLPFCRVDPATATALGGTEIDRDLFDNLESEPVLLDATRLDCSSTALRGGSIPTFIGRMTKLTFLGLANAQRRGLIPSELGNLDKLTHLDLSNNRLSGSITELGFTFSSLIGLSLLNMEFNLLEGQLPLQEMNQLVSLRTLKLKRNSLTGQLLTDSFANLDELTTLDLRLNALDGVLPSLQSSLGLQTLDVGFNNLSGEIPSTYQSLANLGILRLDNNQLFGTIPSYFSSLAGLTELSLGGNELELVCDNDFLELYNQLISNVNLADPESIECSSVNIYGELGMTPGVIKSAEGAPGTHVVIESANAGVRTSTITWTFDSSRDITIDGSIQEVEDLISFGQFNFILGGTTLRDCKPVENPQLTGEQVIPPAYSFGFEISIDDDTIRECYLQRDLTQPVTDEYELLLSDLVPARTYNIKIRPFYVYFPISPGEFSRIVFGIQSASFFITTGDDIPESAPLNFQAVSATSTDLTLGWDEPIQSTANGAIEEYQITLFDATGAVKIQEVKTNRKTVTILGLDPNTEYRLEIRARTSAPDFSDVFATLQSKTCPSNMRKDELEGEISSRSCRAVRTSFQVAPDESLNCELVVGSEFLEPDACNVEGLTVVTLGIKPGFWRANVNDYQGIKKCPKPQFCKKENQLINTSDTANFTVGRRLSDVELESVQCSERHRGTYCFSCEEGHVLSSFDGCIQCDSSEKEAHRRNFTLFISFVGFCCILCAMFILSRTSKMKSKRLADSMRWTLRASTFLQRLWRSIGAKLRILESYLQVLFAFQIILYPGTENSIFGSILEGLSNLNLVLVASAFDIDCALELNHYTKLIIYTIPPIVLVFILWVFYRIVTTKYKSWRRDMQHESFNVFFVVSFLIYPGASKIIFDTFYCEHFESVTEETETIFRHALRADYRISCAVTAEGRIGWISYAALMVLVYPIGILAVYLVFLRKYNLATGSQRERYKFLVNDLIYPYRENRYWFEAYELVRKLLQTAFVSFCVGFGEQAASSTALNLTWISLGVLIFLNPYKKKTDFVFAIISLVLLVFATQLDYWHETAGLCDQNCNDSKTADTIIVMAFFELIVFTLIVLLEYCFFPDTKEGISFLDVPIESEVSLKEDSV